MAIPRGANIIALKDVVTLDSVSYAGTVWNVNGAWDAEKFLPGSDGGSLKFDVSGSELTITGVNYRDMDIFVDGAQVATDMMFTGTLTEKTIFTGLEDTLHSVRILVKDTGYANLDLYLNDMSLEPYPFTNRQADPYSSYFRVIGAGSPEFDIKINVTSASRMAIEATEGASPNIIARKITGTHLSEPYRAIGAELIDPEGTKTLSHEERIDVLETSETDHETRISSNETTISANTTAIAGKQDALTIIDQTYVVTTEAELIAAINEIEVADIIASAIIDVQAAVTTTATNVIMKHKDKTNVLFVSSTDNELTLA